MKMDNRNISTDDQYNYQFNNDMTTVIDEREYPADFKFYESSKENEPIENVFQLKEKELRSLLRNAPIGIYTYSLNGGFYSANKAYCDIIGYSEEELKKIQLVDITVENYTEKNIKTIQDLVENKINRAKIEKRYICKDNKVIDVVEDLFIQKDENEEPEYWVSIINDTTYENEMKTLLCYTQNIEGINMFTGGVAHNFNNLLQNIFRYLNLIKIKSKKNEKMTSYIDFIKETSSHVNSLVSQILTFSNPTEVNEQSTTFSNLSHKKLDNAKNVINENQYINGHGNILLIEDNEQVLEVTRLGLIRAGYEVEAKSNQHEALESFLRDPKKFDIIITDYLMPDLSGDVIASKIHEVNNNIPVLLYTGCFSDFYENNLESIYEMGVTRVINKPVAIKALVGIIEEVTEKN